MFNINIPNDEYNRNSGLTHSSAFFECFEFAERLLNDLKIDIQILVLKL